MITADQPTRQTRHIGGTKLFVFQDCIKEEHTSLESLRTQYNLGNQFTEELGRIKKFYEHANVTIGRHILPNHSLLYTAAQESFPYQITPCNTPKLHKPSTTNKYVATYRMIRELLPTSTFDLVSFRSHYALSAHSCN